MEAKSVVYYMKDRKVGDPMAAEHSPLLEISGIKKYFDVSKGIFKKKKQYLKAVDRVNLTLNKGETVGIVGESGCGKSTLANIVMGALPPDEGNIIFDNTDIYSLSKKELKEKRRGFQMVFQDPSSSLNPRMTVFDIIAEPLKSFNIVKGKQLIEEVEKLLSIVGLDISYKKRYPHEFSGGQRQRIVIARALALKPKLIVCDEPVSALDVSIQAQILNLLRELQDKYHLTYLFIGHGLPSVHYISDRIAVMYLGEIVETGKKDIIFQKPAHPYTRALLSSVPVPDPDYQTEKRENTEILGDLPNPIDPPSGCKFHTRCPIAQDICKQKPPVLSSIRDNQQTACHFPITESLEEAKEYKAFIN
ncbi:ABC transporter ATP-binding protein [Alteribacillus sp. YIM 98480]|uniref:ABC transporter ATP-binding protein n=1 Tax=Alteribacillus sp. YIM 98480 TaxID=2606599 RepID=UPI002715504A|nr:oligopeptide/dipeptide ABC transporter ATP-binding protein [Alteribacillus sp. YIM 98480]